ncbi:MAG TPA: type II secretion system protein GspM [Candidatus Limnocylindrales bacterium]|nr:type II secretion system protein GspM [Candidatus Limnocylindrales bacterium]
MTPLERWNALSGRERALVGGALAVALIVVLRYGSLGGDEEVESGSVEAPWVQVAKIENYRRVLARSAAIERQTSEIEARLHAQQERLSGGATATQVAAELQGTVSQMASDAGLNVLSSQILKEEEAEGSKRVGVRLTLSGELAGVAKLLASVEGGQKDLVVSHLEINRKLGSTRRPNTVTAKTTEAVQPPLTVSVEIRTFMRQGA